MKAKTKSPGKQRKWLYEAPYHSRGTLLSAHMSSDLRSSHNTRSMPVRKGDTVKILRGDYKGYEGKVTRVDRKEYKIFVEGINREKSDGTSILVPIHASKAEIIRLDLGDKRRSEIIERKKRPEQQPEVKATEKEKAVKVVEEAAAPKKPVKKARKVKEKK
jgi:large subunit ribosomal protein L24